MRNDEGTERDSSFIVHQSSCIVPRIIFIGAALLVKSAWAQTGGVAGSGRLSNYSPRSSDVMPPGPMHLVAFGDRVLAPSHRKGPGLLSRTRRGKCKKLIEAI
jgi:hypothetical protein